MLKAASVVALVVSMGCFTEPAKACSFSFTIYFDIDSTVINPRGRAVIARFAEAARSIAGRIAIVGHADRSGNETYNTRLSIQRANTVKEALVSHGLPSDVITVRGYGESQPSVQTLDGIEETQNRRVELVADKLAGLCRYP